MSYLKAPAYQDGHPAYSNPIDEQDFVTEVVEAVQHSPFWRETAIIIAYDDSEAGTTTSRRQSSTRRPASPTR